MVNLSGLLETRTDPAIALWKSSSPPPSLDVSLLTPLHPTYMHLRIELLGGGGGGVGPRHVAVCGQVLVTVGSVPVVDAGGPGQGGLKRGEQVVQGPGHDGVVVEGYVEGYDADGKADP